MKKFELYEDVKVQSWRRYFYTIEAETLEEALQQVIDGDADCDDSEELYDVDYFMNPYDNNGGCATREISDGDTSEIIWNNVDYE